MAKSGGRKKRSLNKNPKGKGKAGSRWGHGFKPKNATARLLKKKTYRKKGSKTGARRTRNR